MELRPRLVVPDARALLPFYEAVLGVIPGPLLTMGPEGRVVHVELSHQGRTLFVLSDAGEDPSPSADQRTSVVVELEVEDPDAMWERAMAQGASSIYELSTQPYGHRGGRFRDPAGHQWLIYTVVEELTAQQQQQVLDQWAEDD